MDLSKQRLGVGLATVGIVLGGASMAEASSSGADLGGSVESASCEDTTPSYTSSITVPANQEVASEDKEAALLAKLATITVEEASQAALAAHPGSIVNAELENENGNVVYSVEIETSTGLTDVAVDAGNVTVLAAEPEGDVDDSEADDSEANAIDDGQEGDVDDSEADDSEANAIDDGQEGDVDDSEAGDTDLCDGQVGDVDDSEADDIDDGQEGDVDDSEADDDEGEGEDNDAEVGDVEDSQAGENEADDDDPGDGPDEEGIADDSAGVSS